MGIFTVCLPWAASTHERVQFWHFLLSNFRYFWCFDCCAIHIIRQSMAHTHTPCTQYGTPQYGSVGLRSLPQRHPNDTHIPFRLVSSILVFVLRQFISLPFLWPFYVRYTILFKHQDDIQSTQRARAASKQCETIFKWCLPNRLFVALNEIWFYLLAFAFAHCIFQRLRTYSFSVRFFSRFFSPSQHHFIVVSESHSVSAMHANTKKIVKKFKSNSVKFIDGLQNPKSVHQDSREKKALTFDTAPPHFNSNCRFDAIRTYVCKDNRHRKYVSGQIKHGAEWRREKTQTQM